MNVIPSSGGTVMVQGSFPVNYPFTRTFPQNDTITMEAVPEPGYVFTEWSSDLTGNENPTSIKLTCDKRVVANFVTEARKFASEDNMLSIFVPEGTDMLDKEGNPLNSLEITLDDLPPPLPAEGNIVGLPYLLGPAGTTFNQPVTLTWIYDPGEIPPRVAEQDLTLTYYDETTGQWVTLPSTVNTLNHTITAVVEHLTIFAIVAPAPPPLPASFTSSSLSIAPAEVNAGETVTISVLVSNAGEEEGSYNVTLKIDGVIAEVKKITLAGGSQTVIFTAAREQADTYSVDVNGLQGSFTVKEAPVPTSSTVPPIPTPATPNPGSPSINWAILGPVIFVVLLLIFLVIRVWIRRSYA